MRIFITGGTGFIGRHVVEKLVARGDEVHALVRSARGYTAMQAAGASPTWGDITIKESMRAGMSGSDAVFHLAGWYKEGTRDQSLAEMTNVLGTRNVLELACELGVPRILHTSTVTVFGDTGGWVVDETYCMPASQPFLTEYDRTKWLAHYCVAEALIQEGAPVIIVLPGVVYGPGDPSLLGQLMRSYYAGWFAFFPGPKTILSYVHVDDIASGILLAAEKGRIGESYVLTGPSLTLRQASQIWSRASGRPAPLLYVPSRWIKPLAPLARVLACWLPMPEIMSEDAVNILGASYSASPDKARQELGWQARPVELGFQETFKSISVQRQPSLQYRRAAMLLALSSLAGFVIWRRFRRWRRFRHGRP